MRKFGLFSFFVFFFIALGLGLIGPSLAQDNDAIGIQVRPNPDRYSALRWYREAKGFSGAPQVLQVDGYDAIRDGRTVYVNAANLVDNQYYSNIYLISYSQDSAKGTSDVFAGMLKHWTFNTNLTDPGAPGNIGHCKISTMPCKSDKDCQKGYSCSPDDYKCHLPDAKKAELTCWRDRNCPKGLYCDSNKAKLTRRAKRYANLADIRTLIMDYKEKNGENPPLSSGSYLPGVSLSTWPSWNSTLAKDLGAGKLPLDPLNIMGACVAAGFDPKTCWNENDRRYVEGNANSDFFQGPQGSSFLGYYAGNANDPDNPGRVYSFSPDSTFSCPLARDANGRLSDCEEE